MEHDKGGRMESMAMKPLSIEQAGNFIKDKSETIAADIKQEAKKQAISTALPEDRKRYLMYGISFLGEVSESVKNSWCAITGKAPALYATKEVTQILRRFLVLRINGYSLLQISHHLKESVIILEKVEALAIRVAQEAIARKRNTGYPLMGNN